LVIASRFLVTVLLLGLPRWRSATDPMHRCECCGLPAYGIAAAAMTFGILTAITLIDISLVILILYLHPILIAWIGHMRGRTY
jgi:threonine/homoserine efflux transporter RhtA